MSAQQQIRKLESLLERIQANRRELAGPSVVALMGPAGPAVETAAPPVEPTPEPRPRKPIAVTPRATPMEQAIRTSAEREPSAPEITIDDSDDDEPVLTIEASGQTDAAISDSTPTAPVHTRAPDVAEPPAKKAEPASASRPQRIATTTPQPSAPIAKVVSRAAPQTFGELIDRALALRPR